MSKVWKPWLTYIAASFVCFQTGLFWPHAQAKLSEHIVVVLQAAEIIHTRPLTVLSKPDLMQAASKEAVQRKTHWIK